MANILFGRKPLLENLTNANVISVDLSKQNRDLINQLKEHNISFQIKGDDFFYKFDKKLNHQGVVVTLKEENVITNIDALVDYSHSLDKSIVLVVDEIQDPQNFGSILRTCDAIGVDAVIYKKNNQTQINDFVSKASMGAIQHLNLIKVSNLSQALEKLKKANYWIYTSCLDSGATDYRKIKYDKKSVLVVGNEENGVSPLIISNSDFLVKIPMLGKIQSLNVSVATGILLSRIEH